MGTIILIVRFAKLALQTRANLSADTHTISNLDGCDFVANLDGLADDFMTDADGEWAVAPTASDGMNIRAADAAALNLDVDVAVFKLLWFELERRLGRCWSEVKDSMAVHLFLFKIAPFALILDHIALEHVWVRHLEG